MKHVKRTISLLLTVVLMAGILFCPNGYVELIGSEMDYQGRFRLQG